MGVVVKFKASYLQLLEAGELQRRSEVLNAALANCVLCPHQCEVNRLAGEHGFCGTLKEAVVSSAGPHPGEEDELVGRYGSGTIFFSHCNLKCLFCQNYHISHYGQGRPLDSKRLARLMLNLQQRGCHNINLVSPGHVIPQIVEAILRAAQNGLNLPIVYNTNSYDLSGTLRYLDGIVDIYLADLKFADDAVGRKYMGVSNYYAIASSAVKEMHRQVGELKVNHDNIAYQGLMIRHLLMPQNLADTEKIMDFIAKEVSPYTYINLMGQYHPAYKAYNYPELRKPITPREWRQAVKAARAAGLKQVVY